MKDVDILLFLSKYAKLASEDNPKGAKCEEYRFENSDESFKGTQTNDAPVCYMIEKAKK